MTLSLGDNVDNTSEFETIYFTEEFDGFVIGADTKGVTVGYGTNEGVFQHYYEYEQFDKIVPTIGDPVRVSVIVGKPKNPINPLDGIDELINGLGREPIKDGSEF